MGYQIRLPAGAEGKQAAAFRQLAGEVGFALSDLERRLAEAGVLKEGAVAEEQLAASAVTADKLAAGAVTAEKLAASSVTAEALADSAAELIETAAQTAATSMGALKSNRLLVSECWVDNLEVKTYISNLTFSAALEGYTPMGVVGYCADNSTENGANASYVYFRKLYLSGDDVAVSLRCTQSSGAKIKLTVYVLYAQN